MSILKKLLRSKRTETAGRINPGTLPIRDGEVGKLESVLEKHNSESWWDLQCMRVLDRTIPQDLLDRLEPASVEARAVLAEVTSQSHVELLILARNTLYRRYCNRWEQQAWMEALSTWNRFRIQTHHDIVVQFEDLQSLAEAISSFLRFVNYTDAWAGVAMSAPESPDEDEHLMRANRANIDYYGDLILREANNSITQIFNDMTGQGNRRLPEGIAEVLISDIEETSASILRNATSKTVG